MLHNSIFIFTDGASSGNPGPGGFGAVLVFPEGKNQENHESRIMIQELGGFEKHTTNNRMELQAVISSLSFLDSYKLKAKSYNLLMYSDSSYVINGITKWIFGWQRNNWITSQKKPVENRDLWEKLFDLVSGKEIEWKLVGGHVGVAGNERCDEIARTYADTTRTDAEKKAKLYNGLLSNYPIKNILDIKENSESRNEKDTQKSHSKAKAYSYVSLVDGKIQTHKRWAECEKRVKGKPNVEFKKVLSKEDENALIKEWQKYASR